MKKLLFTAYNLDLGGVETALISLLKSIDYQKYEITLILEKKEGIFLKDVPKNVKVLEYKISDNKIKILRKVYNRLKLIKWKIKLKNKYDFSCSFATSSIPGANLALKASKNSTLWMHLNYYALYQENMADFLDGIKARNFHRLVFVSNENLNAVCGHYEGIKEKAIVCNNIIDGKSILEKSTEKIELKREKIPTLINVGRHEENQKKLMRIINALIKLKEENYKFRMLFIGDGPDQNKYKKIIKENNMEDSVIFLGRKNNPFPYYKISDATVLSSDYEGYPVVFIESLILNIPIISTKISDWEELDKKYGLFCDLTDDEVYNNIKKFLDNGFKIKKSFDYQEYNLSIIKKLEKMINNQH